MPVQLLPLVERFLAAKEFDRDIVLDPLVLDRGTKRGNIQVKALPPQPFGAILVQSVGVFFSDCPEQSQLMLPLRPYYAVGCEPGSYLCPTQTPVCAETVLLLIKSEIIVPPLEKGHDIDRQIIEKSKLRCDIPAFQQMPDIPSHIHRLGRIVVKRNVPLIFGDPIGQVRRAENSAVRFQQTLIPGKRIIIKRISSVQVLRSICVEKVIHQKNIVHVLLVKDSQKMDFFFVRKNTADRIKGLCVSTNLGDNKEL